MNRICVVFLGMLLLVGCAGAPATDTPPPDEVGSSSDGTRGRAIDPAAQKALLDRMKNCCAPAQ